MKTAITVLIAIVLLAGGLWLVQRPSQLEPGEPLDPSALIKVAMDEIVAADNLKFRLNRTGQLPEIEGFEITSVEGVFASPDSIAADLRVQAGGLVVLAKIIGIADSTWLQDPFTQQWNELADGQSISVGAFLSPSGLPQVVSQDLTETVLVQEFEIEDLPGEVVYQLRGILKTDKLAQLTDGFIEAGSWPAEVFITPDGHLRRIEITDGTGQWIIDVWGLNDPSASVSPPG